MSESGYISVELDQLLLTFSTAPSCDENGELPVRIDFELVNHMGVFNWASTSDWKATSNVYKAVQRESENSTQPSEGEECTEQPPSVFTIGLLALQLKTNFIDLNVEVMSSFANALVSIKIVVLGAKEEVTELCLPLFALLTAPGACISAVSPFSEVSSPLALSVTLPAESSLIGSSSSLSWRLLCDNDMTEYCVGSSVLQCEKATLVAPPTTWGLHYADVIDPKAKVPPTAEQLRAAWLENIPKLVDNQSKIATFSLSLGGSPATSNSEQLADPEEMEETKVEKQEPPLELLPVLLLSNGTISFDSVAAAEVSLEEDIRSLPKLWSIEWADSPKLFLTRQQLRKLAQTLGDQNAPLSSISIPVTVVKAPTAEGSAAEGEKLNACSLMDASPLAGRGCLSATLSAELAGAGFVSASDIPSNADGDAEGGVPVPSTPSAASFSVTLSLSSPILSSPLTAPTDPSTVSSLLPLPPTITSSVDGSVISTPIDPLEDLRKEISAAVKAIAQEYVMMFPHGMVATAGGKAISSGEATVSVTMADRKAEFLHYLSTNGAYHAFKEGLKPKIQLVVRHLYGPRGQALGRSALMKDVITDSGEASRKGDENSPALLDKVLAELYTVLIKESNAVMNDMFSATIVAKDTLQQELSALATQAEPSSAIDDENETLLQAHNRLLLLADDAESDGRIRESEEWHLERLLLCSNEKRLGSVPAICHHGHDQIARFYLRQAATVTAARPRTPESAAIVAGNLNKARQALQSAYACDPSPQQWPTLMLLGCVLAELGQTDKGIESMKSALTMQATQTSDMPSFGDFDGYDSDTLCGIPSTSSDSSSSTVDPLYYAILAAMMARSNQPVRARKALRLADRCFVVGNHNPPVATHGSPKRTLVLLLAKASTFLSDNAIVSLASSAYTLAIDCETAVTTKAHAKNLSAATPPFIRYCLRLAQSKLNSLENGTAGGLEAAEAAVLVAVDQLDIINSNLAVASSAPPVLAINALLSALNVATTMGNVALIASKYFIQGCRLLLQAGRTSEAFSVAASACRVHASSSLFLLLGISCLKDDRLDDAEDALVEANLLDNRNSSVWAYLALLCLATGAKRLSEAEACLYQALRLGLTNTPLLRELATAFMSCDKLTVAEDLIRRAIAGEEKSGSVDLQTSGGKGNPYYRKLLGDVLAGQQQAASAIEEYKKVIANENVFGGSEDEEVRVAAAEKCLSLLQALGRNEEAVAVKEILSSLRVVSLQK